MTPSPSSSAAKRAALAAVPPLRRLVAQRDRLLAEQRRSSAQLARLRQQLDDLQARHADLARTAAGLVPPEQRTDSLGYLFLVTYGRSGSTLLSGIVNAIPGYLMRGENRSALYHLFAYHSTLVSEQEEHAATAWSTRSAWYGIDEYAAPAALVGLRRVVVQTMLRPRADTRVIGFKEIRWWQDDWADYLKFLQELFPGARFLINTRDHAAVARSRWWAERAEPLRMLERYERRLDAIAGALGERAYRVHYDDYVADPDRLRGLFDWLGEPFDRERIDAVMQVKHSH